ncbi:MAG: right-handed parallel beta-helix repeat-containing protein, partial [Anaerolineae bacterium]|nr:right-handed parallel beta-helix repeat-containing protein [Anaerolineae bacterium]
MTEPNAHRKWVVLVSVVIFLTLGSAPRVAEAAGGSTYYVATNGNDTDPGTLSQPWRTIQHAVEHVSVGDTIIVREGTYDESVNFSVSGQEGAPIVLAANQDEQVIIDGGEYPALGDQTSTQYWTIEGFVLDSDAGLTIDLGDWEWYQTHHWIIRDNYIIGSVGIYGSYNIVEGNEIDGSQHKGYEYGVRDWTEANHHNLYKNNHIHDFYDRGIWSMYFAHDSIFEGNHIHDIGGQGIDLDGFSTVVWRHTVRNNYIHDCGQKGIAIENAFETVVENNVVHDIAGFGIEVINYGGEVGNEENIEDKCRAGGENDQYGDTDGDNDCRGNITGNIIRQNLVYNIGRVGGICIWYAGGVSILGNTVSVGATDGVAAIIIHDGQYCPEIRMQGNIISGYNTCPISVHSTNSLTQDSHNLIYQPGGPCAYYTGGSSYSLSQYQDMTGKGQGSIAADARFVDRSGNDFHLFWDSPVIDGGIAIGLSTDLDGGSRPQGLDYDMGAYEFAEYAQAISIPLHSGWNLVSVPVRPNDTSAETVLSTIAGNYDLVYAYDASDESAPWKSLDPSV